MKILISAAETSSDQHGAELLRALRALVKTRELGHLEAFGMGGPCLEKAGLKKIVDARELLAMGFTEIFSRLPRIFRAIREMSCAAKRERPDLAVVIDYPDFHFRLAKRLKADGIPVIYYIPPKVWVWRKARLRVLRERFARLLCIFPFEVEFYEKARVPACYVGNPLVDELPISVTKATARERLGIDESSQVIVLMPGSRPSELSYHLELMLEASLLASREMGQKFIVLLPFPLTVDELLFDRLREAITLWELKHARKPTAVFEDRIDSWLDIRPSRGDAPYALLAADTGLIKSGTSTLEAGILGCVHAVVYKTSWFSHFIFNHIVRIHFKGPIGLVNLVSGWKEGSPWLVEEFVDHRLKASALATEIISLFRNQEKRTRIQAGLAALRAQVLGDASGGSPSERAAREILDVYLAKAASSP